ncbi:MAG: glycosyl hydrolase [Phycisphaerales bacterium]
MKSALTALAAVSLSATTIADPPSIATSVPAGWEGPKQASPQPPGLPVQAPYPIADWWFSQIFKWSAAPSEVPKGNGINPLPLNLIVGFNGLAIFHPYPRATPGTIACGGGSTACPGFEAIQPPCYRPEVLPGLATDQLCPFWWPSDPIVAVQGFSTWSETFDMPGNNSNNCPAGSPSTESQRLRATVARGSPYVWVEFPDASDSSVFNTVQVQLNDASGQIFGSDCQPDPPNCNGGCNSNAQPYLIWTNSSNYASSVSTPSGNNQGQTDSHIAVASVNGRTYALVAPTGSWWEWNSFGQTTETTFYNRGVTGGNGSRWVVVAALPANTDALIAAGQWTRADAVQLLASYAYFRPANESSRTATKLTCAYAPSGDNNVTGTFSYETLTDIRTGQPAPASQATLFALFPHQTAHLTTPTVFLSQPATYSSAKGYAIADGEPRGGYTQLPPPDNAGQMRLARGRSFTLGYSLPAIPPVVPPMSSFTGDMTKLNLYLDNDPSKYGAPLGIDTYNWGKHLSRAANNYLIATAVSHTSADFWKTRLSDGLGGWFTALASGGGLKPVHAPCPDQPASCPGPFDPGLFSYDAAWGSVIGYPAGFGSNTFLNDHHFHYGYFLRAAAVLAGADATWRDTYRPFVDLLARDLAADYDDQATVGGVSTQFAAFNYFDPYSGHGNAAGVQQYANGINQESSSEAVNAWYGMLLWANATANDAMKARAAFMYCSEADAARRYWFQEDSQLAGTNPVTSATLGNIFDNVYQYGGFSPGPQYLHIINWLPFGGGAQYLAANVPYAAHNYQALVQEYGSTNWSIYADLIWMYRAISDPADAKAQFMAKIGDTNGNEFDCDSGNTLGMTYWWIWSNPGGVGKPPSADLDGDGQVNGSDLGVLLSLWGSGQGVAGKVNADLDGDGVVGGADLGILLAAWTG